MNHSTLGRTLAGLALGAALAGCASTSHVVPMGNNTFVATRVAANAFSRDTAALTAQAKADAAQYCAARGKQLKIVDVMVEKPFFSTDYAKAKVVFQPVDAGAIAPAGEPAPAPAAPAEAAPPIAATEPPPPVTATEAAAPAPAPENPSPAAAASSISTDELYRELMKLDDLRKRGILTEAEFEAEKKKVLERSK